LFVVGGEDKKKKQPHLCLLLKYDMR